MGNTGTTEVKGDKSYNISTEKIKELQEKIRNVDDTMCGFVKTLDCMRSACELLFRQCDKRHDLLNKSTNCKELKDCENNWKDIVADEKLAVTVLKTIEESLFDQRQTAIDSLGMLLNCLMDAGKEVIDDAKGKDTVLSLDMYLSKCKHRDSVTNNNTFNDWMVESLQKEVKLSRELIERNIEDIMHLEQRDKLNRENIDIIRESRTRINEKLTCLQSRYDQLETEHESLKKKLQDVSAENTEYGEEASTTQTKNSALSSEPRPKIDEKSNTDELTALKYDLDNVIAKKNILETELCMLKRKQYIHVQIISDGIAPVLSDEIVAKMKARMETPTSLLYVVKLDVVKDLQSINPDVPMLFLCHGSLSLQYCVPNTLDKMNDLIEKEKVALVAIHRNAKPFHVTKCEFVLRREKTKNLGGMFDIVHEFSCGIYDCDMNENALKGLTDFVETNGFKKSVLETLGLLGC